MPALAGLACAALLAAAPPLCGQAVRGGRVDADKQEFLRLLAVISDNPNDKRAREAIIKLVDRMDPKPPIPVEAKRDFIKAVSIHMDASAYVDFDRAVIYYEKALKAAPWWGQCYYNLAAALDSAKRLKEADELMAFYRRVRPAAAGQTAAAAQLSPSSKVPGGPDFSGSWGSGMDCWRYEFILRGSFMTIMMRCWDFPGVAYGTAVLNGRDFEGSSPGGPSGTGMGTHSPIRFKGRISEDNDEIKIYSILAPDLAGNEATLKAARDQVRLYGEPEWQTQTWQRMSGGE